MNRIKMKLVDLPSTNNGWGFGGARNKVAFVAEGSVGNPDDGWVFGIACFRHIREARFLRNRNLDIDRSCGSVNQAKKYIESYYNKLGIQVEFETRK